MNNPIKLYTRILRTNGTILVCGIIGLIISLIGIVPNSYYNMCSSQKTYGILQCEQIISYVLFAVRMICNVATILCPTVAIFALRQLRQTSTVQQNTFETEMQHVSVASPLPTYDANTSVSDADEHINTGRTLYKPNESQIPSGYTIRYNPDTGTPYFAKI
jgi:hypothetical protein